MENIIQQIAIELVEKINKKALCSHSIICWASGNMRESGMK